MLQDRLHRLNGLWLGDTFLKDYGLKLLNDLTVFDNLLDESRLHHLAIVGNSIVEGNGIDGCNLRFITDTHPWERRLTPVFGAIGSLCVRYSDHWSVIAYQWNF